MAHTHLKMILLGRSSNKKGGRPGRDAPFFDGSYRPFIAAGMAASIRRSLPFEVVLDAVRQGAKAVMRPVVGSRATMAPGTWRR